MLVRKIMNAKCIRSENKTLQQKAKHMITERNAEYPLAPAAPQPDSDSSIENQNGRTDSVSKIENSNGQLLLNELQSVLERFVVLPTWASETLALWVLHTHAFELRDVSTYLGIESPEKRCGKTTLLGVLNRLANRPVAAADISPSAFFRVIEEMRPTLLIDEADTFLRGNDEIRGILNAGYTRDTAYVMRVTQVEANAFLPLPTGEGQGEGEGSVHQPNASKNTTNGAYQPWLKRFSCWCPKVMAAIGRLPDTLADRCIVIRMQTRSGIEHHNGCRDGRREIQFDFLHAIGGSGGRIGKSVDHHHTLVKAGPSKLSSDGLNHAMMTSPGRPGGGSELNGQILPFIQYSSLSRVVNLRAK
jgi:hypothetical protein